MNKKDERISNNFIASQLNLFDLNGFDAELSVSGITDRRTEDKNRNVLVTLLALGSIKGMGFRGVCQVYDDQAFNHIIDGDIDALAELPLFQSKRFNNALEELKRNKQQIIEGGA